MELRRGPACLLERPPETLLVPCPVALFPASSEREKISFNQINKKTGNRIKYREVDAETGDEVDSADIIKGYEVGKGQYIEIEPDELEAVAIESKRTSLARNAPICYSSTSPRSPRMRRAITSRRKTARGSWIMRTFSALGCAWTQ
jgi:Ku70/Ku80 beta-barrel domain